MLVALRTICWWQRALQLLMAQVVSMKRTEPSFQAPGAARTFFYTESISSRTDSTSSGPLTLVFSTCGTKRLVKRTNFKLASSYTAAYRRKPSTKHHKRSSLTHLLNSNDTIYRDQTKCCEPALKTHADIVHTRTYCSSSVAWVDRQSLAQVYNSCLPRNRLIQ